VRFEARQPEVLQEKAFSLALAFGAGQFPALFDHISFSVADITNHFILPASLRHPQAVAKQMSSGGP
jgi:hypothetical protein